MVPSAPAAGFQQAAATASQAGSERPVTQSGGWVPGAMSVAAAGYRESYGTATDLSGDDEPTVRVRWAVPWRLAASAAVAVALVVGATLIRATALAPGDPVDLPTPAVVGSDASGATSPADRSLGGTSGTTTAGQVVVHVVGAVASPGVVRLPSGSRLEDAITAAGGALPDANLEAVNLARVLTDGEQVEVPRPGEVGGPTAAAESPGAVQVDLNTAELADLDALPGIGPVLAQRILDRRRTHRFTSVEELGEVSGIGPTLLQRLRPLVRV